MPNTNTYPAALHQVQQSEKAWAAGRRSYAAHILREAARELACELDARRPEAAVALLLAEREAAVAKLEDLCRDFGDDNWAPNLHLADIIDKHLGRYLHAARNESQESPALAPKPGREPGGEPRHAPEKLVRYSELKRLVLDYFTATDEDQVKTARRYRAMIDAAYARSGPLADLVVAYDASFFTENAKELCRLADACVDAARGEPRLNGGTP